MVAPTITSRPNNSDYDVSADQWNATVNAVKHQPYSYLIYTDGAGNYYAKNGETGEISWESTVFTTVYNNVASELTSGGTIYVKRGSYDLTTAITIENGTTLLVEGQTTFIVKHSNSPAITIKDGDIIGEGKVYINLWFDVTCIYVTDSSMHQLENLVLYGADQANSIGIHFYSPSSSAYVDKMRIVNCKIFRFNHNIVIDSASTGYVNRLGFYDCYIQLGVTTGITFDRASAGSSGHLLSGCEIAENNIGLKYNGTGLTLSGCTFDGSDTYEIQLDATHAALKLVGCKIWQSNSSKVFDGSSVVDDSFDFSGNFPSHKIGNSTGTGAEQTIAHGLVGIPSFVLLSPPTSNATESSASDTTNIYVTADNGEKYYYYVEYKP